MELRCKELERLFIVNLYLPPASRYNERAEQGMREEIHDELGDTPINDPVVIVRDINAHIWGNTAIYEYICPYKYCQYTYLVG